MIWIVLVAALFNIMMALATKTKDFASSIIFKVIPFFLGMGCFLYFLKIMDFI